MTFEGHPTISGTAAAAADWDASAWDTSAIFVTFAGRVNNSVVFKSKSFLGFVEEASSSNGHERPNAGLPALKYGWALRGPCPAVGSMVGTAHDMTRPQCLGNKDSLAREHWRCPPDCWAAPSASRLPANSEVFPLSLARVHDIGISSIFSAYRDDTIQCPNQLARIQQSSFCTSGVAESELCGDLG